MSVSGLGDGSESKILAISPYKCRTWSMHDRLGEELSVEACASLIRSIDKHGQKQPALGRRIANNEEHEIELIYGARRLFAAHHLGIELLVELRNIDDRAALVEMDIENRVRTDISPYERGLSYKRWLRRGYFDTQAEVAKSLGVSEAKVSRLLRYSELPAAIVGAFASPRDIREEWAVALAKRGREPGLREAMSQRARRMSGRRAAPQQVYDSLVADGPEKTVQSRSRDEVIKNSEGAVMFRVGYRAKTVHIIFPRDGLTSAALKHVTEGIACTLKLGARSAAPKKVTRRRNNGADGGGLVLELYP